MQSNELTPAQHVAMAEKLLAKSRSWESAAQNPDAAGPAIRERWRREAEVFRQEALVHAQLGTATDGQVA